jgi:putative flippase GtrA
MANAAGSVIALVISYLGQSRWTFSDRQDQSLTKFLCVAVITLLVGSACTWLIVDWAGKPPAWAVPVLLVVIPLISYLMISFWAFRDNGSDQDQTVDP